MSIRRICTVIELVVRGPGKKVKAALEKIDDVESAAVREEQGGVVRLAIQTRADRDLSEAVSKVVSDNEWRVVELHRDAPSLEEAFAALTRRKDGEVKT